MKRTITLGLLLSVLMASFAVTASMLIPANANAKENAKAPEKSFVIGDNWDLERVDFVHYLKPLNSGSSIKTQTCYKLMGFKWNALPVSYVINPTNGDGLSPSYITQAISTAAETWDAAASKELFNNIYTIDDTAQYGVRDFKNSIAFGSYSDNNVIAVTSVWYTRVGKQIVEFDMLFNDYYSWGDATINPAFMDLKGIATHELGHSIGLDDIYTTTCSAVTMYGYSTYGETSKTTLEQPDITGLQKMYGV